MLNGVSSRIMKVFASLTCYVNRTLASGRAQQPSRASVRMLEKCLSTKIFNPGGFRRKTPAVIIGGRKTEKISQNPEFDDFRLQQFPHCSMGNTGSAKRG